MNQFDIRGVWGPREEDASKCANRCFDMLNALSHVHSVFDRWYSFIYEDIELIPTGRSQVIPFDRPLKKSQLEEWIEENIVRDDNENVMPTHGYSFSAYSRLYAKPYGAGYRCHAGAFGKLVVPNSMTIETYQFTPTPALSSYETIRAIVLAMAEAWNIDWSRSAPDNMPLVPDGITASEFRFLHQAWIFYLSPPLKNVVKPPRSAVIEHLPNGGMLLAATKEPFDINNPAHVAAARDIFMCLVPASPLLEKLLLGPHG